jgi:hypothetical protein
MMVLAGQTDFYYSGSDVTTLSPNRITNTARRRQFAWKPRCLILMLYCPMARDDILANSIHARLVL